MTQEEKAKAYDEALERANKQRADYQKELDKTDKNSQLAGLLRAGISAIDMALPELAESEDERVIKALKTFINQPEIANKITFEARIEWLAWLEKQKECVANNSKTSVDEDERMRKAALEGIKYLERNLGWDAIGDTDILDVKRYIEKQKPVGWSEEDEKKLSLVIDCVYDFYPDVVMKYKLKDWLGSLPERGGDIKNIQKNENKH